jgi:PAS domain S-box-containing protein
MGPFSSVPRSAEAGFVPFWLTPSGCTICTMGAVEHSSVDGRDLDLRQVIDSAPALIHTARADGYIDFFNRTWLDFVGEPLRSLLGWKWTSWIHPDDVESFVQKWRESIATGERFEGAARVRRADGEYRWMLHHKLALRARDGEILKWHGSSIDIQERKRAEEELKTSAELLQRNEFYLAEAQRLGQIGSWVFNPTGGFDYWSRELFHIYGLDPEKHAPTLEEYLARVHPHDREFMASLIKRMLAEGLGCDVTKRIVRPDGELRHIRCVGAPVVENGTLKRIVGSAIDVTEHEVLTQELRRREAYLAEAQRLSHTGSFGWRPGCEEHVWSDETYCIFEYDPATKVTLDMIMERVHPEDRNLVLELVERASTSGSAIDCEYRLLFPDDRVKYVRVLARPLGTASDDLEFAGAVIDITEAKRAEDHLRDTRIKLSTASKIATVAELSASIAHELNQPLMAVLGNAQAAKRWLAANPPNLTETNASIERILRDIRLADEAMQRIRALFKSEPYEKSDESVLDIIRESLRFVHEDPNKREVQIDWSIEGSLPPVCVDRIQTQQIFINLISNAIEATDGSANTAKILLRAFVTQAHEVIVQVIDNGTGLEDTEKIFDAFVTTKEKGMGIGLAVSRSIVEAHGGRIWAENNPDRGGATFNVAWPMSSKREVR